MHSYFRLHQSRVFTLTILFLLLLFVSTSAFAKTYTFDEYGFLIDLPDDATVLTEKNAKEYSQSAYDTIKSSNILFCVLIQDGEKECTVFAQADYGNKYANLSYHGMKSQDIIDSYEETLQKTVGTEIMNLYNYEVYDSGRYKFAKATLNADEIGYTIYSTIQGKTMLSVTITTKGQNDKAISEAIIDSIVIQEKTFWSNAVQWFSKVWEDHPLGVAFIGGPFALGILGWIVGALAFLFGKVFHVGKGKTRHADATMPPVDSKE